MDIIIGISKAIKLLIKILRFCIFVYFLRSLIIAYNIIPDKAKTKSIVSEAKMSTFHSR